MSTKLSLVSAGPNTRWRLTTFYERVGYTMGAQNFTEESAWEKNHEEGRRATENKHFLHVGSAKKLKANSQKHRICATKL